MKEISDIYCKKRRIEEIDNILSCLVEEIGLTEAMKEKAVRSYKAVGSVLDAVSYTHLTLPTIA